MLLSLPLMPLMLLLQVLRMTGLAASLSRHPAARPRPER